MNESNGGKIARILISLIFFLAGLAALTYCIIANTYWWVILVLPPTQLAFYFLVPHKVHVAVSLSAFMIGFVVLVISIFTFSLSPFVWGAMLMISGISFGKIGDRNSTGSSSVDITKMSSAEQAKYISELTKDKPKNERASVVGRAAVGYMVAGNAGAVVGALSAIDKNNKIDRENSAKK